MVPRNKYIVICLSGVRNVTAAAPRRFLHFQRADISKYSNGLFTFSWTEEYISLLRTCYDSLFSGVYRSMRVSQRGKKGPNFSRDKKCLPRQAPP